MDNPNKDWSINPERNWSINPIRTWSINPIRTWSINPQRTWSINPIHTWSINPQHTWSINPQHTWSINPRHTNSLKPSSIGFNGYMVVDKNKDVALYYTVDCKVKENVLLIFDGTDNPVFFAVGRATGYSIFEYNSLAYVGYMESNGKNGYNWFDVNGQWLYYVVKK